MKEIIVRISAWFTLIIFSITSLVSLTLFFSEKINIGIVISSLMCILFSLNGWNARKYGLASFKIYRFSKPVAILSLIFGIIFIVFVPILFSSFSDSNSTFLAIRNLVILFSPVVISSIAILGAKPKKNVE